MMGGGFKREIREWLVWIIVCGGGMGTEWRGGSFDFRWGEIFFFLGLNLVEYIL